MKRKQSEKYIVVLRENLENMTSVFMDLQQNIKK